MNYLDVNQDKIKSTAKALNQLLADYNLYYQKLRNFHWNVIGTDFFELHTKFEEMYGDAQEKIDTIAERILTLGFHPASNLSDYLKMSTIKESESTLEDKKMVEILLKDHHSLLQQISKVADAAAQADDNGTEDLMDSFFGYLEESAWMLKAWSRKGNEHYKSL